MTSLFVELARTTLGVLLIAYSIVAISHFVLQLRYAHRTYRRQRSPEFAADHPPIDVAVDILVPVYNEDPSLLEACLASAVAQDHLGPVRLVVVDDGSPNRAALDGIYDRYEELGARIIRSPTNVGKRRAQALGLRLCTGEILVTLDSDSVLKPDAVRMLTRQFADPKVGAATGFVDVSNRTANLLTRIQRVRYWMAFNQERAAQTWFRTVLCCSGPLAAYRRAIVESVRDAYLAQTYGGVECTYGDDRHLTNLVLGQGYDTVYDSGAIAWTNVPTSLGGFLRQQLRWNKSFYRELIWTVPYISSRPWYTRFDVTCQVAMPVMLTITAGSALILGVFANPLYVFRYVAFIAAAAAIRSTYAVLRERDLRFYLFVLYGYVSAFLLMSVRLRALGTLTDARWGTRGHAAANKAGTAIAGLAASIQPLVVAPQSAGWPNVLRPRRWGGGQARLDGAWRAGLRQRAMAHPLDSAEPPMARVSANLAVSGVPAGSTLTAPGWLITPPDPSARWAGLEAGRTRTPAYIPALPEGHFLYPLGAWRIGPTCRHAVATNSGLLCPACGSRPGPVFDAAAGPVAALQDRLKASQERRAARAAAEAALPMSADPGVATITPEAPTKSGRSARRAPARAPAAARADVTVREPGLRPRPKRASRAASEGASISGSAEVAGPAAAVADVAAKNAGGAMSPTRTRAPKARTESSAKRKATPSPTVSPTKTKPTASTTADKPKAASESRQATKATGSTPRRTRSTGSPAAATPAS